MKLQTLCFEGDYTLEKREKEKSNYCYVNLYAVTFGIAQYILTELMPIDLDGCGKLTVCANVEPQNEAYEVGYHTVPGMGVSWYNLDIETSRRLYNLKRFCKAFSEELSNEFEDCVANIIMDILVEIDRMQGGKNRLAERRNDILERMKECGCEKEILLEKYSKLSRDRKYRAMVYRCIGHGIGDAIRVDLVNCATREVVVSKWLHDELPNTIDMAGAVTKTAWDGDAFNVTFYRRSPSWTETVELPENES
ncbi:hypothetical protein [Xylanibacter rodentium]|uniref:hypothetical protein n=1 Tax=Xylanibacter rodentium TaxID=2736289 RepID=UPI00258F4CC7|nr:hypothetical protein [Xylanibacter rodentium]